MVEQRSPKPRVVGSSPTRPASLKYMINKIITFVSSEVPIELKKVTWPTKAELIDATIIVVISAFFLGIYVAGIDFVFSRFLALIIQ